MSNKSSARARPMRAPGPPPARPGRGPSPSSGACAIRRVHSPGGAVGVPASREHRYDAVRSRFEACGQAHVFRFWDRLGAEDRERLLAQAAALDLEALLREVAATRARDAAPPRLEPVAV